MAYDRIRTRHGSNRGRNNQPLPIEQKDWRGVNYVDDIYTMPPQHLPFAQNVDLGAPIGAISKVAGYESLFTSLGAGKILGLHAWEHSDGDKLIAAWDKYLYLLSGASGSIAKTSRADWDAGTKTNLDTATSPGDVKMAKTGTDFSEADTLTADFNGTHSNTVAATDSVKLTIETVQEYGIVSLGATSSQYNGDNDTEQGWKFTVGASNIIVSKLRVFWAKAQSITLRLWRVSDSALLSSVTVTAADSSWVVGSISPITLTAGASYVVSAGAPMSPYATYRYIAKASNTYNSKITCNEGRYYLNIGYYPSVIIDANIFGITDIGIDVTGYNASGTYTHTVQNISGVGVVKTSTITFNKTVPAGTTLTIEVRISTDGGSTWGSWTAKNTGDSFITAGTDISNYRFQWRANLSTTDTSATPTLADVTISVTTAYYTAGVWLSPVLDMGNTPMVATLSWTQTIPANTTVTWYARGSSNGTVFGDWQEITVSGDAIPLLRYAQVKFEMTGTISATATVSDFLIGYSTSYTQANRLDISPLGRTSNLLTGNRVRMQDYDDRCYCADGLRPFVLYVNDNTAVTGTAQSGTSSTIRLAAGASAVNDFFNNAFVTITGGTGVGQTRFISDYNGSTKDATVSVNWTTNPDATSTYSINSAVKARKAGVDPPGTAPTLADSTVAGTPNGVYYGKITFVNAEGYESNPSSASASVTVASKKITWTVPVDASAGKTTAKRKLYRTKAGGSVYYYIATVADNTTTAYTDNIADASLTVLMEDNNNIPPSASIVYAFMTYMFYASGSDLWFSKVGTPEQVPNITGDMQVNMLPSVILDIKSSPMALIPQGENFIAPITTNTGFIFDSDPTVDTTIMRLIDKNGSLSFEASDICIDPQLRSILVFPTNTGVRTLLPGLQEGSIESTPMSRNIQNYFDRTVNRTNMAGIFFNSYYLISVEHHDPDAAVNEYLTFAYDFRTNEWYGPWTFGCSCYIISAGVLYAGDPAVGKIYRMFTGSSGAGANLKMIADLPMISPGGENRTYRFNKFMLMLSADSDTSVTTVKPKVDSREATVSLGTLTDTFTGDVRPGHNNLRSKKYKIPLSRGNTLSYRIEDDSTHPISIQKVITECEVLPLKK